MSSDDDKPLVVALVSKKKAKKKKTQTKPPRYSKFADMHAKEGKEGHTASEGEISEDDKDQADLSYVISESEKDNRVSSDMQAIYTASLCSQASEHGFGTPMFKRRAKERGISRGSIFDGIVARDNEKRKRASMRAQIQELHLNPAPVVSPSSIRSSLTAVQPNIPSKIASPSSPFSHRSSVTTVLSLQPATIVSPSSIRTSLTAVHSNIPSKIASPSSPFSHRSSVTAVLSLNPATMLPPSSHQCSVTRHQKLFEDNVCSRGKVNRLGLIPHPSFSIQDGDISQVLNDAPLHSETTKRIDFQSIDIATSTGQNKPFLQTFTTATVMPASCDMVQFVPGPSSPLRGTLISVEKLRYLEATAQVLSTKINHLSLISDGCNDLPATDHILPRVHDPNRNSFDCHMPSNGNALRSPLSPLPENFVADSPVSRWDVWRRQPGIRLCNTAVQTSPNKLVPKRSMTPFCFPLKVTSSVCTQTETQRHDAAMQTCPENTMTERRDATKENSPDDAPLTLKNLKDELKAFAIAFGF